MNKATTLAKRQLIDSIWKSTGIEGLGTTFPTTEAIIENLPVKTTRDEVYFVCNMKRAWEFLFDTLNYPTNLSLLRELNSITMENLAHPSMIGRLRNIPVHIGGTTWVPDMPHEGVIIENIKNITQILDDKVLKNLTKIEKADVCIDAALNLFCFIARSQMFIDGNKRMAQLISNKILIENDIGILSIPQDKLLEFKDLLIDFYESNDNNKLKSFLKDNCITYADPDYVLIVDERIEYDPEL